ncbi:LOW QUALITY PROTEIN: hypothetical protein OSB04_019026 [Centaurea solstitialis]|uniref:Uncharacterized protein n=1 Tax=Centaurea solstitialis TaxID=347529 RepID=A0AA38SX37_9ASTR|nr:LOW QUALITY PROTEIN: hypothetical protein OSB04_019026 [Centaurea solstitialis]
MRLPKMCTLAKARKHILHGDSSYSAYVDDSRDEAKKKTVANAQTALLDLMNRVCMLMLDSDRIHRRDTNLFKIEGGACGALTRRIGDFTQGTVVWGEEKKTTIETLRRGLCEAPVLTSPEEIEDRAVYCENDGLVRRVLGCDLDWATSKQNREGVGVTVRALYLQSGKYRTTVAFELLQMVPVSETVYRFQYQRRNVGLLVTRVKKGSGKVLDVSKSEG